MSSCRAVQVYQPINLLLGHGSILTHPSGPLHRLVRKGIAPAFSAQNIRYSGIVSTSDTLAVMGSRLHTKCKLRWC